MTNPMNPPSNRALIEAYLQEAACWSMGHKDINMSIVEPVEALVFELGFVPLDLREKLGNHVLYSGLIDDDVRGLFDILAAAATLIVMEQLLKSAGKPNWQKEGF